MITGWRQVLAPRTGLGRSRAFPAARGKVATATPVAPPVASEEDGDVEDSPAAETKKK
jgi:hypothetical protein